MSKKYYRFFGGLLTAQEHWLNKMSEKGYRLIRAEKMLYEFEECKPDQVKYCVEFIGQKSKANASDYHEFLEGMVDVSSGVQKRTTPNRQRTQQRAIQNDLFLFFLHSV